MAGSPWHHSRMVNIPDHDLRTRELEIISAWLEGQTSANTRAAYRTDLEVFGRWCAQHRAMPLAADAATVAAFQHARQAVGDSAATMRRRRSALSSFYRFAIDNDAAAVNPVADAQGPSSVAESDTMPILTERAVDAYLAVAAALDPRLDALVSLLVFDGLKLGEALALDVDDVVGRPPKVSLSVRRKGVTRRVALKVESGRAVRRCAGQRRREPLFTSARPAVANSAARRLTRFGADHLIRQLTDEGEERVTTNAFRRFYIWSNIEQPTSPCTPPRVEASTAGRSSIR
jgi:site-specific recombinase XerD